MNRNFLIPAIILIALAVFGYYYFQFMSHENVPGENKFRMANKYLQDGEHDEALQMLDDLLASYPEYKEAHLARAITLLQMNRYKESKDAFNRAISLDENFAAAYANRGILNDRMGEYTQAVSDYRRAVELDPETAEGPGYLWRFLHNVNKKPSTIADRADYIEAELKKPESERLLRVQELDDQQRMYKK
ncbi:MAG: tetratricopeptide repeat protein [Nitrospiraceae bacterium]|jgi:tetratricopeptide (TPR) repeat protein|nr:MAG: tetratricopeptide repeat protein [Nitrospiraceae bacterium]